jgi:hypothetical protein
MEKKTVEELKETKMKRVKIPKHLVERYNRENPEERLIEGSILMEESLPETDEFIYGRMLQLYLPLSAL